MTYKNFKDYRVYNCAEDLVAETYKITEKLPYTEKYGLVPQLQRAAVSVTSNFAEGHSRGTDKEFSHFLSIASGSVGEIKSQLLICVNLGFVPYSEAKKAIELCNCVGKMLTSLRLTINRSIQDSNIRSRAAKS
jgi:four helix bundle protein